MEINKRKIKNVELHDAHALEKGCISITFQYENEKYEIQAYIDREKSNKDVIVIDYDDYDNLNDKICYELNDKAMKKFGYEHMRNIFYSIIKRYKKIKITKIDKRKIKNVKLHDECTLEDGFISITFEYENEKYEIQACINREESNEDMLVIDSEDDGSNWGICADVNEKAVEKFGYENMMNIFYSILKRYDHIKII